MDAVEGNGQGLGPRDQHDIEGYSRPARPRILSEECQPRCFAEPAPGPVAGHRAADLAAGADPDPGGGGAAGGGEADEAGPGIESAPAEQALEVTTGGEPGTLLQIAGRAPLRSGRRFSSAGAEARATLPPPVLDDAGAAHGAHPLQKTVHAAPVPLLGLVCPFDVGRPLFLLVAWRRDVFGSRNSIELAEVYGSYSRGRRRCQVWCVRGALPPHRAFARIAARKRSWGTAAGASQNVATASRSNHSIHGLCPSCG
jgi:hypothetical protein